MNPISPQDAPPLPQAVRDLAVRLGANLANVPPLIRLTQNGRMKRDLRADSWMAFTATQSIATGRCEFDWRARAGPFGLICGRDALVDGEGRFDITALGIIPIARAAHTAALVRGELMRYLAEIAWAPHAILHNHALGWRVIDAVTLAVSAGEGDTRCEVTLSLDGEGRIAGGFAPDRPRNATMPILPTPWRGQFSDYRCHNGVWLPFSGEVAWEIDGSAIPYWQGRIDRWAACSDVR